MTFTHGYGAVVSVFDELPNRLHFVGLQLQCVKRRGGGVVACSKEKNKDFQAIVD